MRKQLTAVAIAALKPKAAPYYVSDAKTDGLRIRVAPSGVMTWNVAFRIKGEGSKSVSLGRCDPEGRNGMNLASARERAASIVKAARDGRHLLAEEQAERQARKDAFTIEELISLYAKHTKSAHRKGGPLRTADDIDRRLRRALATKLDSTADNLRRADISRILDDVADTYPREAEKRRQTVGAMFAWGVSKGYVNANPVAGTSSYGLGDTRNRVLSADEIRTFWQWLDNGADGMPPDAIAVLRLQLLLGARVGEVAGMEASELAHDGERLIWRLPASRSKNKRERVTPLAGVAKEIAETAWRARPKGALFRTLDRKRALRADDIGLALNHRDRPIAHFTTHDLRRTVVSGMDELGIALETIAAVIGHQRGTRDTRTLIRHYSRPNLDHRVEAALIAWQAHLQGAINGR
ncbi:tyrosine-type recombinase/integrase [Allomesorhizobium alhagi]|uniref:Phage integrase family protein n=1 Tax=Mesorhizobium alhagi CCNWXJ12-2 TaxID=1107882 RepID=H0HPP2_9HYPH|nr:integrase family protein [Mesorhizobium alhagi]EHK57335.1 phage integrase family protein [Mesorhizobium alhagi CCNWXJ12-2]